MKKLKRGTSLLLKHAYKESESNCVFLAQGPFHFVVLVLDDLHLSPRGDMPLGLLNKIVALDDGVECEATWHLLVKEKQQHVAGHIETFKCITGEITDDENKQMRVTITDDANFPTMNIVQSLRDYVQRVEAFEVESDDAPELSDITLGMLRQLQELEGRLKEVDAACKGKFDYDGDWLNAPFYPEATPRGLLRSCYTEELV